jgi:hypothetical protein
LRLALRDAWLNGTRGTKVPVYRPSDRTHFAGGPEANLLGHLSIGSSSDRIGRVSGDASSVDLRVLTWKVESPRRLGNREYLYVVKPIWTRSIASCIRSERRQSSLGILSLGFVMLGPRRSRLHRILRGQESEPLVLLYESRLREELSSKIPTHLTSRFDAQFGNSYARSSGKLQCPKTPIICCSQQSGLPQPKFDIHPFLTVF